MHMDTIRPAALLRSLTFPGVRPNTQGASVLDLLASGPWRITRLADELGISTPHLAVIRKRLRAKGYAIESWGKLYSWKGTSMKSLTALLLALALGGCSMFRAEVQQIGSDIGAAQDPAAKVDALAGGFARLTIADLTAAKADADAHGDRVSSQCWTGVIPLVSNLGSLSLKSQQPVLGLAGTLQRARDIRRGLTTGGVNSTALTDLNLACAALVQDEIITGVRLLGMLGVTVSTGGLGGLPALGGLLGGGR